MIGCAKPGLPYQSEVQATQRVLRADALLDVAWRGHSYRFVAELKRDAKPLTQKLAIDRHQRRQPRGQARGGGLTQPVGCVLKIAWSHPPDSPCGINQSVCFP